MKINQIRTLVDLRKVASLHRKVFSEPPYNERWKTDKLVFEYLRPGWKEGKALSFYSSENGEVIGYIISKLYDGSKGKKAYIAEFGVRKDKRKEGIGTALMHKVFSEGKKRKVTSIDLAANIKSKVFSFYRNLGFKETKTIILSKKL